MHSLGELRWLFLFYFCLLFNFQKLRIQKSSSERNQVTGDLESQCTTERSTCVHGHSISSPLYLACHDHSRHYSSAVPCLPCWASPHSRNQSMPPGTTALMGKWARLSNRGFILSWFVVSYPCCYFSALKPSHHKSSHFLSHNDN